MAFKLPEKYRMKDHPLYPPEESKAQGAGAFILPGVKPNKVIKLLAIASQAEGWQHVSITLFNVRTKQTIEKTPSWVEMCYVKGLFWDAEDFAVQFHPPESEYVSLHPNCLHLWRPVDGAMQRPPSWMVGPVTGSRHKKRNR